MSRKNVCPECHWKYPASYLYPMRTSAGNFAALCGICALAVKNKIHGAAEEKFTGGMAEHLRQMALAWRERHPDMGPQGQREKPDAV